MWVDKLGRHLTLAEVQAMPTLNVGHFSDLKLEQDDFRVLLSRMTSKADLEGCVVPHYHPIEFEVLVNGVWRACLPNGKVAHE
jgi:hypothetical protein